jgi:acyl-CoA synthetase (AMP-forming)/AMP-acid ligase II
MLYRHPAVAEAAVLGLPDTRTGERVVAVVVPQKGRDVELDDIREHCRREGLAIQKCPEQLEIVDALPRNAMGKVLKQDLRSGLL